MIDSIELLSKLRMLREIVDDDDKEGGKGSIFENEEYS